MKRLTDIIKTHRHRAATTLLLAFALVVVVGFAFAQTNPNWRGKGPKNTMFPLPGAQPQELMNITFPSPYNVFEFPATCGACHGGTIDQQVGHFGNWAGTVMANTARSPVFRADWIVVNEKVKSILTSLGIPASEADGASNACARCHVPNAFLSGRADPKLGGDPLSGDFIQQITLSTDNESIQCEFCHRTVGGAWQKRVGGQPSTDPAFRMLGAIADWPHTGAEFPAKGDKDPITGLTYTDAPSGPIPGAIMGIATYQVNDAMTYAGKYVGGVNVHFSDIPFWETLFPGLGYTGQTYGVYPNLWTGPRNPAPPDWPQFNPKGEQIVYMPDGSVTVHFEATAGPPPEGPEWQAYSPEHSTTNSPAAYSTEPFLKSSEFCGVCHDRTLPPASMGMPRAKEYTEWKLSVYGKPGGVAGPKFARCQDCHMPTLKHEYSDAAPVGLNCDPSVSGWWPYAKDRNPMGGTALHKFPGANYNLAQQFKILYPEVDMEVIGAPTGRDTRMFPGLQSSRDWALDRDVRNSEIMIQDAAKIEIVQAPLLINPANGIWEVKVKITDKGPHRFPSGLPDGRRAWINLNVRDSANNLVYESGHYDPAAAKLTNGGTTLNPAGASDSFDFFKYAQTPVIDATGGQNAVMVYERRTGHVKNPNDPACKEPIQATCAFEVSFDFTNRHIIFDNRIMPEGYTYSAFDAEGVKLRKFNPVTLQPSEDATRYPDGQNYDVVTYRFKAPLGTPSLSARAELYAQTHTREFLDFLVAETRLLANKGPRPEGPPNILDPNYPLTPNYLSDKVIAYWNAQPSLPDITNINQIKDLNGVALDDTWAGIAYASWLLSGKAKPILVGAADTKVTAPPAAPSVSASTRIDPATGLTDPFGLNVTWNSVAGAEGYVVWIRYGKDTTPAPDTDRACKTIPTCTASWDRLAIVYAPQTSFFNDGLNVNKTYQYQVQAFNAAGFSGFSAPAMATTPQDLPLFPMNLKVTSVTDTTVTLAWFDQADNETGFIVERQNVPLDRTQPLPNFVEIARCPSQTPGPAFGGNSFTDGVPLPAGCTGAGLPLAPGRTYNYRVAAYNGSGMSTYNDNGPVAATTLGKPPAPTGLAAANYSSSRVDLTWNDNSGSESGFRVERSNNSGFPAPVTTFLVGPNLTAYSDTSIAQGTTYYYRVFAYNSFGDSLPSNVFSILTLSGKPPTAPGSLKATPTAPGVMPISVTLTWKDVNNETGYIVERATDPVFTAVTRIPATGTLAANTTTYIDSSAMGQTTYWYRIRAVNAAGSSPYSNVVAVVTPGGVPNAPENLMSTTIGKGFVTLTWTDLSTNEAGFYVERSTDGVTFSRVATTDINVAAFTDNSVKSRTTYTYRVQAYNANGLSGYTNLLTVTTL